MTSALHYLRTLCSPFQSFRNDAPDLEMGPTSSENPMDFKNLTPAQALDFLQAEELPLSDPEKAVFNWSKRISRITKAGLSTLSYVGLSTLVGLPYAINMIKLSDSEEKEAYIKNAIGGISAVAGMVLGLLVSGTFPTLKSNTQNEEQNNLDVLKDRVNEAAAHLLSLYGSDSWEEAQAIANELNLDSLENKLASITTQQKLHAFNYLKKVVTFIRSNGETSFPVQRSLGELQEAARSYHANRHPNSSPEDTVSTATSTNQGSAV